eukprot:361026-Chlamydomonas_euryale.AAC.12
MEGGMDGPGCGCRGKERAIRLALGAPTTKVDHSTASYIWLAIRLELPEGRLHGRPMQCVAEPLALTVRLVHEPMWDPAMARSSADARHVRARQSIPCLVLRAFAATPCSRRLPCAACIRCNTPFPEFAQ